MENTWWKKNGKKNCGEWAKNRPKALTSIVSQRLAGLDHLSEGLRGWNDGETRPQIKMISMIWRFLKMWETQKHGFQFWMMWGYSILGNLHIVRSFLMIEKTFTTSCEGQVFQSFVDMNIATLSIPQFGQTPLWSSPRNRGCFACVPQTTWKRGRNFGVAMLPTVASAWRSCRHRCLGMHWI